MKIHTCLEMKQDKGPISVKSPTWKKYLKKVEEALFMIILFGILTLFT